MDPVGTAIYEAPALTRLRRQCLSGVIAARRVSTPLPPAVMDVVTLVNHLGRLWGEVRTANQWSVADPRGVSVETIRRRLKDSRSRSLPGSLHAFSESRWPDLRRDTLELADLLTDRNPRLDALLSILDWAQVERPGARVVVRTASQSMAFALIEDLGSRRPELASALTSEHRTSSALDVVPYSKRFAWAANPSIELHLGVPPPWRHSSLGSAEATEQIVVFEADEAKRLEQVVVNLSADCELDVRLTCDVLQLGAPPRLPLVPARAVLGPLAVDSRGLGDAVYDETMAPAPEFDLAALLAGEDIDCGDDAFDLDVVDDSEASNGAVREVLARPITLRGDQIYWLPADGRAEVLAGNRYAGIPVSELTVGAQLLVSRGTSRQGIYTRLQQVAHAEADVMAVNMMLGRFRRSVMDLRRKCRSWDEVASQLADLGSHITSGHTCRLWATGDVIAPDDVHDIRRVGVAVGDESLSLDGTWQRIGRLAEELRRLHRALGRLLSTAITEVVLGQPGPGLARLAVLCGDLDAAEILEGFEIRAVSSVGPATLLPSSQLRRLVPANDTPK
jgi:hypothetical protein